MPIPKLTNEIISAAILGFEEQKRRLDAQIADLHTMLSGGAAKPASEPTKGVRRKTSAATRKAMAEGQRKRWAAKAEAETPAKPKRRLSAAGKAAIVAALKKRWAAKKAVDKKQARPKPGL